MPILLLADNYQDFLETRCEFFQRRGFEVLTALGPVDAKNILEREHVDLAILDLRLLNDEDSNDISGLEVARHVALAVPKIILTRFPSWKDVRAALGAQLDGLPAAVDFVDKKEGPHVLLTAVRNALLKYGARQHDLAQVPALIIEADISVSPEPIEPVRVLNALVNHFNLEELRTLCFDLGVDFDSLLGEGKEAKARELVAYFRRRRMLGHLLEAIRRARDGII